MIDYKINIQGLVDEALSGEDKRGERILMGRYGLGAMPEKETLAALGNEHGLTRERIRQIESSSLSSIRERIREHEDAIRLLRILEDYFIGVGHIRKGGLVSHDVGILLDIDEHPDAFYNKLHFLSRVLDWPHISGGNEEWNSVWYTKQSVYKVAKGVVAHLLEMKEHDFDKFMSSAKEKFKISEVHILNHLTISRKFGMGPYGDMGAHHWIRVNPKTVRDKVYVVLNKSEEPLHFREIALRVNELSSKKRAPATVHNELIKDPRFVLASRGMYTIDE